MRETSLREVSSIYHRVHSTRNVMYALRRRRELVEVLRDQARQVRGETLRRMLREQVSSSSNNRGELTCIRVSAFNQTHSSRPAAAVGEDSEPDTMMGEAVTFLVPCISLSSRICNRADDAIPQD